MPHSTVHVDVKKLGRNTVPGHRITGTSRQRSRHTTTRRRRRNSKRRTAALDGWLWQYNRDLQLGVACARSGHILFMPLLALIFGGWLLASLLLVAICVAARRDDEALDSPRSRGAKGGRRGGEPLRPGRVA